MRIRQPVLECRFLKRYKRFFADVELPGGRLLTAFCPNTGSLLGCLEPGARAILRDSENEERKLRYVLQSIVVGRTLVNVDTSLPNAVVHHALLEDKIPELGGYATHRREVKYGESSRIDVLLEGDDGRRCYLEVKSTTLAAGGLAQFPDAVTERGRKHLRELRRMVAQGHRAVQFFFVSRSDVERFRPADHIDPEYGRELRRASRGGVELLAYAVRVTPKSLVLAQRLPIDLA
jgi:sugar fermentation stimulation protein A